MFGETQSESPRMPSPWDALASTAPSPSPSPLALSICASTDTLTGDSSDRSHHTDVTNPQMKYLDANVDLSAPPTPDPSQGHPKLVPEIEEGNVEYKLKLLDPSPSRFARLVTQLKYRLLEGGGQALYEIGVSDFGDLVGLSRKDLSSSLDTLDRMAGELGATVVVLKEIELPKGVGGKMVFTPEREHPPWMMRMVGKKQRDKEARRNRRAAALVVEDIHATGVAGDDSPPTVMIPLDPPDSTKHHLEDLSQTVTLTALSTSPAPPATLPIPMPIITDYPYGRRPFASHREKVPSGRSVESEQDDRHGSMSATASSFGSSLSSSYVSISASGTSCTESQNDDDYVYMPNTSTKSEDEDDRDRDRDVGFSFDIDIATFTAPAKQHPPNVRSRPLHFSSSTLSQRENDYDRNDAADCPSPHVRPPKSPRQKKKALIPAAPPKGPNEKRAKRDRHRARKGKGHTVHPDIDAAPLKPPGDVEHDANSELEVDDGPRVIAEALVVRKLALEEAFLDFGGFSLVDAALNEECGGGRSF